MNNYLQLISSGEMISFNQQMNKHKKKTPEQISGMLMDGICRVNCKTISMELKDMLIKYIRLSAMRMDKETLPQSDQAYIVNLMWGNVVKFVKLMYFDKKEYHAMWNAARIQLINTGYLPDPNVIVVKSKKKSRNLRSESDEIDKIYPPLEGMSLPNKAITIS